MQKTDKTVVGAPEKQTLNTPPDSPAEGGAEISSEMRKLLADVFTLYVKTKNFHWHMSGRHFRDYHLLLDEQAKQIFAGTDDIASASASKIGGTTLRSIGHVGWLQRALDNEADFVTPFGQKIETVMTANPKTTMALAA